MLHHRQTPHPKYHIVHGHIAKGKAFAHEEETNDLRGITVYGMKIGTTAFTANYLRIELVRIEDNISTTGKRMNPTQITVPKFPGHQFLWQLNFRCLQHMVNY